MGVDVWDGENFQISSYRPPVSIVWFTGVNGDIPYKGFCRAEEIQKVLEYLLTPENPEPMLKSLKQITESRVQNSLCLFCYKHSEYASRIVVCNFDLDENDVFIGPRGKSPALGKMLKGKEESGLEECYGYMGPIKIKNETVEQQMQNIEEQKRKEIEARPFELIETTLEDFSKLSLNCRGILFRHIDEADPNHADVLLGDLADARWIVGRPLQVDKVIGHPGPLITVFGAFRQAERIQNSPSEKEEYQIIFLDGIYRRGYLLRMGLNEIYVYGPGYRSRQLRKEFAKLGLFKQKQP